jgi:hypothetical protein
VVELRLFGRFLVFVDGVEVAATVFGGRKVRALLRVLAARRAGDRHSWRASARCTGLSRSPGVGRGSWRGVGGISHRAGVLFAG